MKFKNLFFVVAFISCTQLFMAQSSMFLGTPDHLGVYTTNFPEKVILKKIWSIKTGGKIFGTASIDKSTVYFGSDDSCLYAAENNGSLKWKIKLTGKIRSTPTIKDTLVFINDYSGCIYALKTTDGSQVWKYQTEGESRFADYGINGCEPKDKILEDPWDVFLASPVYKDSAVYFACGKNIYAFNMATGAKYWSFQAGNIVHSSPALSKGILYFGCWNSKIYALNASTGEKIWDFQTGTDPVNHLMSGIQSSPTVIDSLVLIGSRDANVYAIHATTGKQIWKTGFGGSWMPSSFTVVNDTIYTGSSDAAGFFALNKKDGKIKYSIKFPSFGFSTPVFSNGTIFMGCANGSMFCIDAISRKIKARFDSDAHRNNYLNALRPDGTLNPNVFPNSVKYEDNVKWCEILFSTGSFFTTPIIAENKIFIGSTDSSFYAIEDDGSEKPDFEASSLKLILTNMQTTTLIDTVISITNHANVEDSMILNTNKTAAKFKKGVSFEPSQLSLLPGETKEIRLKGSLDFTTFSPYKTSFTISSLRNEYIQNDIFIEIKVFLNHVSKPGNINVFPSPTHGNTNFEYSLDSNSEVEIDIYNNLNQKVKYLYQGYQFAGKYKLSADLSKLPSGIYFFSVNKNGVRENLSFVKE